jgi:hypothetical protein
VTFDRELMKEMEAELPDIPRVFISSQTGHNLDKLETSSGRN